MISELVGRPERSAGRVLRIGPSFPPPPNSQSRRSTGKALSGKVTPMLGKRSLPGSCLRPRHGSFSHRKNRHPLQLMRNWFTLLSTVAAFVFAASSASAAVKYWDINGATPGAGGPTPSGAWNTTSAAWSTDSTGSSATTTFTGGGTDSAVFSAGTDATGTYTVTVSSTLTAGGLTVEDGTLNLTGSALTIQPAGGVSVNPGATLRVGQSGTLSIGTGTITVNTGAKLSIVLSG